MSDDEFDALRDRIESLEDAVGVEPDDDGGLPIGPKEEAEHEYALVYVDYWVNVYEDGDGDYRLYHTSADSFQNRLSDDGVLVTRGNDLHGYIAEMVDNE